MEDGQSCCPPRATTSVSEEIASTPVKVFIRFRPPLHHGTVTNTFIRSRATLQQEAASFVRGDGGKDRGVPNFKICTTTTKVKDTVQGVTYAFDAVFDSTVPNKTLFERALQPLVQACTDGVNGTIFAYGQTASGKTYTMQGNGVTDDGIIAYAVKSIFETLRREEPSRIATVSATYLEIYNEKLIDLIAETAVQQLTTHSRGTCGSLSQQSGEDTSLLFGNSGLPQPYVGSTAGMSRGQGSQVLRGAGDEKKGRSGPKISEDGSGTTIVTGARSVIVTSADDVIQLVRLCQPARHVAETCMNEHSSRSHSILTLRVTRSNQIIKTAADFVHGPTEGSTATRDQHCVGLLHLVDLAGSECISRAQTEGVKKTEGSRINQSLLALTRVISQIVEQQRTNDAMKRHVSYRDSKLTRLLSSSLGGNSSTAVICCLSSDAIDYRESLSTLEFAARAKCIRNRARVNRPWTEEQWIEEVKRLRAEVFELRSQLFRRGPTTTTLWGTSSKGHSISDCENSKNVRKKQRREKWSSYTRSDARRIRNRSQDPLETKSSQLSLVGEGEKETHATMEDARADVPPVASLTSRFLHRASLQTTTSSIPSPIRRRSTYLLGQGGALFATSPAIDQSTSNCDGQLLCPPQRTVKPQLFSREIQTDETFDRSGVKQPKTTTDTQVSAGYCQFLPVKKSDNTLGLATQKSDTSVNRLVIWVPTFIAECKTRAAWDEIRCVQLLRGLSAVQHQLAEARRICHEIDKKSPQHTQKDQQNTQLLHGELADVMSQNILKSLNVSTKTSNRVSMFEDQRHAAAQGKEWVLLKNIISLSSFLRMTTAVGLFTVVLVASEFF